MQPISYCAQGASILSLPGRYSVTYALLQGDEAAIVDVGSTADVPRIASALERLDVRHVRFVIATHLHFDHVMGVEAAARAFGAPVLLGPESRRRVMLGQPVPWPSGWGPLLAVPGWVMQGMPTFPWSDWKLGTRFGFSWSRNRFRVPLGPPLEDGAALPGFPPWRVLETPGHSPDSICLFHPTSGSLIAGDCVRNYRGGEWNGLLHDPDAYAQTKRRLCSLGIRAVGPGHGTMLFGDGVLDKLRAPTLRPW